MKGTSHLERWVRSPNLSVLQGNRMILLCLPDHHLLEGLWGLLGLCCKNNPVPESSGAITSPKGFRKGTQGSIAKPEESRSEADSADADKLTEELSLVYHLFYWTARAQAILIMWRVLKLQVRASKWSTLLCMSSPFSLPYIVR